MMTRTQITLEPELQKTARRRAAQLGVSLAEYVRRLIARDLAEPGPAADASLVFDLGTSGGADVARDPDQDFSIVDRTSFAVMHRLGIRQVSAFDDDFAVYRYGWDRKAAFDVVR